MSESTNPTELTMYGADWCRDCIRSKALLEKLGVDYKYVDLEADPAAADVAKSISGQTHIPVVQFTDGEFLVEPSDADLQAKINSIGLA